MSRLCSTALGLTGIVNAMQSAIVLQSEENPAFYMVKVVLQLTSFAQEVCAVHPSLRMTLFAIQLQYSVLCCNGGGAICRIHLHIVLGERRSRASPRLPHGLPRSFSPSTCLPPRKSTLCQGSSGAPSALQQSVCRGTVF